MDHLDLAPEQVHAMKVRDGYQEVGVVICIILYYGPSWSRPWAGPRYEGPRWIPGGRGCYMYNTVLYHLDLAPEQVHAMKVRDGYQEVTVVICIILYYGPSWSRPWAGPRYEGPRWIPGGRGCYMYNTVLWTILISPLSRSTPWRSEMGTRR